MIQMFEYGLIGIIGELGCGKTLTLTYFAYLYHLKGFTIYSNYNLKFPHIRIEKLEDINKVKNGIGAFDELWAWIDARASQSKRNLYASRIFALTRKRGNIWFYTQQQAKFIDKRIRQFTDILIFPTTYLDENNLPYKVELEIYDVFLNRKVVSFNPRVVLNLYDTKEETNTLNPLDEINKITESIKKDLLFARLQSKSAKITYISKKYNISREDARLVLELL